jgi:hypothetical protein
MPAARNVFACLVHESPECAVDLPAPRARDIPSFLPEEDLAFYVGWRPPERAAAPSFP